MDSMEDRCQVTYSAFNTVTVLGVPCMYAQVVPPLVVLCLKVPGRPSLCRPQQPDPNPAPLWSCGAQHVQATGGLGPAPRGALVHCSAEPSCGQSGEVDDNSVN